MKHIPILSNPYMMRLFRYLPPYKWLIIGAAVAMVVGGGASSLIALVLGKLTDMGFYDKDPSVIYWAPIALIGISILHGGSQYLSQFLLVRVSQSVLVQVRTLMFDRVLHWDNRLIQENKCARIQAKFINEASTALGGAASIMTTIIRDSLQIVCLVCVLIYHNWRLTLLTFVVAPLLAILLRWVNKRIKRLTTQTQNIFGQLIGTLQESYEGQRVVKIYDGYEYETKRFFKVNNTLKDLSQHAEGSLLAYAARKGGGDATDAAHLDVRRVGSGCCGASAGAVGFFDNGGIYDLPLGHAPSHAADSSSLHFERFHRRHDGRSRESLSDD